MRILFLEIDTERTWCVASLGPAFIAAYLRRFGHEVASLRVTIDMTAAEVVDAVCARNPDLLGVSLTTRQWHRARAIFAAIRRDIDISVVAGGLHPTFSAEEVLREPGIDYACLGEGEMPMRDLVEALARGDTVRDGQIQNVWVKHGTRPDLRPPFEPLDDLPVMARDLLDEKHGVIHMTTQRGCPFPCTYCGARMYNQLYQGNGNYGRRRSHRNVLDELTAVRDQGPLNYVIFLDDTFTIHHSWVKAFCPLYRQEIGVPFSLHARVETINEELIDCLARAGCAHITYGVESGSERIRRQVMKRPVTNEQMIQAFRWTRAAGILATANYMLGLPEETAEELQQTIDLHEQLQPDDFGYFVFYPYPGTHLFQYCRDKGYLADGYQDLPAVHSQSILNLPTLTKEQIREAYNRWTKIRVAHTLKRYGPEFAQQHQEQTAAAIEACAASG